MGNISYGFVTGYSRMSKYSKFIVLMLTLFGFLSAFGIPMSSGAVGACGTTACASGTPIESTYGCATGDFRCVNETTAVALPLCGIYNVIHNIIFLLGIVMMILGGALYAGSHIMPGTTKGTIQGYGMGFILGGVIGVVIAVMAPFIIGMVSNQSGSGIATVCSSTYSV
jgi:hypothetical protein